MATRVVMMVPPYPPKPADRMSIPPTTAPQMPMAMSMNGPYAWPFRIFPADQPATNPTMIHDRRTYISPLNESTTPLPASRLLGPSFSKKSFCEPACPVNSQSYKLTEWVLPHTGPSPHTTRGLLCKAGLQSFHRPVDRQPRQCSPKAGAGDYLWLVGYEYVMRQALRPPPLSRAG